MVRVRSPRRLYESTQLFDEEPNIDFRSSESHEADVFILRIERFAGLLWRALGQMYLNLFLCSLAGIDDVGGSWKSRGWRKVADLSSFIQFIIPEMEIKTWLDKWYAFIFYFSAHLWGSLGQNWGVQRRQLVPTIHLLEIYHNWRLLERTEVKCWVHFRLMGLWIYQLIIKHYNKAFPTIVF